MCPQISTEHNNLPHWHEISCMQEAENMPQNVSKV